MSLKTASRVMNGEPHVRPQIRERVFAAARELGFQVNAAASTLGRGLSAEHIALVTSDIENPFYSSLAKGAELVARRHGVQLVIASSDDDPERELAIVQDMVTRHVRGIVLVSSMSSHESLSFVTERGIPLVFADRRPTGLRAPSVVLDNRTVARAAVEHLIVAGHRRIAFVGDYRWPTSHVDRYAGYLDAMRAHGLDVDATLLRENVHGVQRACEVVLELLRVPLPPTALFAANNQLSSGALYARAELNSSVALVGFDDFDLAELAGVTVVSHDPVAMGSRAAEILFDGEQLAVAGSHVVDAHLIPRGSGEMSPVP